MFTASDERYMERARALGREARFWARPNPAVGCVLVRDDGVIGEGFTQPAGGNHAEVEALNAAGDASGATAYVTLEPCAHQGRTGPCADALLAAGVSRVVAAVQDPNPQVAGGGLARLRDAGVQVDVGLLADQIEADLAGFLCRMRRGWGRVRLKVAASLDGRTAMASGESQWITGAEARADVQLLRAESCAVLTGIGTVLMDDCRLTVRPEQLPLLGSALERATALPPDRVVLDSRGRLPMDAAILAGGPRTIQLVATGAAGAAPNAVQLPAQDSGSIDLAALPGWLAEQSYNEVLVEAGSTLSGALLDAGLVDEFVVYLAPKLLGADARPMAKLLRSVLADTPQFTFRDTTLVGDDLRIIAVVKQ